MLKTRQLVEEKKQLEKTKSNLNHLQHKMFFFILFETKHKTSKDLYSISRPIPRLILISVSIQDKDKESCFSGSISIPIPIPSFATLSPGKAHNIECTVVTKVYVCNAMKDKIFKAESNAYFK
jgi:hypothetical protein